MDKYSYRLTVEDKAKLAELSKIMRLSEPEIIRRLIRNAEVVEPDESGLTVCLEMEGKQES